MPPDVRKRCAFVQLHNEFGLRPNHWAKPKIQMVNYRSAKGLPHIRRHSRGLFGQSHCLRKPWRRNDESGTHYFPIINSLYCRVFVLCREDTGANCFALACAVGNTGRAG